MKWWVVSLAILGNVWIADAQKYKSWFPVPMQAPMTMQKQIRQMTTEFEGAYSFKMDTSEPRKVRNLMLVDVLNTIDKEKNFDKLFPIQYWAVMDSNYVTILPELIARVTDNTIVGLDNAYDILIWERMTDKQKNWLSYAYIVNDDLYQRSGRANYILKKISGENFGDVRIKSSPEKLQELQSKWQKWYKQLVVSLKSK